MGATTGFLAAFVPAVYFFEPPEEERNTLLNTKFTNPYLECTGVADSDPLLVKAKKKLVKFINESKVKDPGLNISVYVRDLNNGPWIGINEKVNFTPASLSKVLVLAYHLKVIDKDRSLLEDRHVYDPEKMISEDNLRGRCGHKVSYGSWRILYD